MTLTIVLIIAILAGFYMAWNIGANDVANAMGTVVGSGALTFRKAIVLAAVFEFCGAFFVGSNVAQTIRKDIVPVEAFQDSAEIFAIGMLAALLAAALWLNVATFLGQPVSTTHAIIGAVVGFAAAAVGPGAIRWSKLGFIALSWIVSPVAGGVLGYLSYRCVRGFILRSRHPIFMAKRVVPLAFGAVVCIFSLSIVYKGMPRLRLDLPLWKALPVAVMLGLLSTAVALSVIHRRTRNQRVRLNQRYETVERWFSRLQLITACYMAFAHGANDVANAIGPLAGTLHVAMGGSVMAQTVVPPWLLAFGGVGIVIGLATYGHKVIEAVGKKITEITPTRGFSAEFGTATTVLVCSKMGLPVSTTFVLVGAVMGVGIARGFGAIDLRTVRRIFASWIVTIPVSAVLAAVIFYVLKALLVGG